MVEKREKVRKKKKNTGVCIGKSEFTWVEKKETKLWKKKKKKKEKIATDYALLSNEVVNDPVNLLLYKIAYPRPFVPQDIIRGKIGVVPTPTTVGKTKRK